MPITQQPRESMLLCVLSSLMLLNAHTHISAMAFVSLEKAPDSPHINKCSLFYYFPLPMLMSLGERDVQWSGDGEKEEREKRERDAFAGLRFKSGGGVESFRQRTGIHPPRAPSISQRKKEERRRKKFGELQRLASKHAYPLSL